jgi:hypothetical protein
MLMQERYLKFSHSPLKSMRWRKRTFARVRCGLCTAYPAVFRHNQAVTHSSRCFDHATARARPFARHSLTAAAAVFVDRPNSDTAAIVREIFVGVCWSVNRVSEAAPVPSSTHKTSKPRFSIAIANLTAS